MKKIAYLLFCLCIGIPAVAVEADSPSSAAASRVPTVRGSMVRDNARITFEWPENVRFTAKAKGKLLTITFDRQANPELGPILLALSPYLVGAERKPDGKTVAFTLSKPYKIRTFLSENIAGVDLLNVHTKDKNPAKPSLASADKLSRLNPAAGTEAASEISDTDALNGKKVPAVAKSPDVLHVGIAADKISATLRFGFNERVAAAAFVRLRTLWIVFSKPTKLEMSDFAALPAGIVMGKPEVMVSSTATVVRVPLNDVIFSSVAKDENGYEWAILLTNKPRSLKEALTATVRTDPPSPQHVFISALEMAEPVMLTDPGIGDELVIVPTYKPSEGVSQPREFIDFSLFETAQGIAIAKKTDEVSVVQTRNGLRVMLPRSSNLTPGLPDAEKDKPKVDKLQSDATLFSEDDWALDKKLPFYKTTRKMLRDIALATNVETANGLRVELAKVYLNAGMAAEALGLLEGINRADPSYYRSNKLNALRGGANFLMARYSEAAHDFGATELNNNKEIDFWRNVVGDLLGNNDKTYDYLSLDRDYISKYPAIFRQKLAIVAADRSITAKDYAMALKILDSLHKDNLLTDISAYVEFLTAKIASDTGEDEQASKTWDKLADDLDHLFVRSRAEFSRIVWGLNHETLSKDEAIDRLERLRLSWHGDNLELSIINMLGELYVEKKDYVNAMRIWQGAVNSFPNTSLAVEMNSKMQQTFISMFQEETVDNLPPLQALAVYYEYQGLTPSGEMGFAMSDRLVDKLVSVDLLAQATALLEFQMRNVTEKEQRSRIGAKLASVHLLDHQPKKALQALQDSVYGENPATLRLMRNRITAQALSDMGMSDKALLTLGQDDDPEAEHVRAHIYWQEKDWPRLAASIESIMKSRKDITAPLSIEESENLIKLSLAYFFEGNTPQLKYVRDYFTPLMANNPNKPMFDFITDPEIKLTSRNFNDVLASLSETRSFVNGYKARVQTADLTPPVK